jgi:hypothetical protein
VPLSFGQMVNFASILGKHGDETKIGNYVKNQGENYKKIYQDTQLALFWF